jgi:ligand-binding sensor domain-containing protein
MYSVVNNIFHRFLPCDAVKPSQGFCCFLFFICLFSTASTAQIPLFRPHLFPENVDVLDTSKNAKRLELYCLTQTPDGMLWLGSNKGLIRYNGIETQLFSTKSSVTALFSSPKTGLWLGCANGYIGAFHRDKIAYWQRDDHAPKSKITGFAEDTLGNFWFSTYGDGAYCFDGKQLSNFTTNDRLASNKIAAIVSNKSGEILLATDSGMGICRFLKGNKFVRNVSNAHAGGLPDLAVKTFAHLPASDVYAGFQNGYFGNLATHNWFKINGDISCATHFEQDGLVVGTTDNGLFFVDVFHDRIDKVPASVGKQIQAVFRDNEGNIWVISDKNKVFSANCRFIPYKTGLQTMQALGKGTAADVVMKEKNVLIGTKDGAYNFDIKTGQIARHLSEHVNVISIVNAPSGLPFVGTYGTGLFVKTPSDWAHFTDKKDLNNLTIYSMTQYADTLWLATLSGLFRCVMKPNVSVNDWETRHYDMNNGLSTDFIYKVFRDSLHHIWLGTNGKGATFFDGRQFKHFNKTKDNNGSLGSVVGIVESPKGTIWLANTEGSIFYGDGANGFTALSGFSNVHQILTAMSLDVLGNIVVMTNKGIDVIQPMTKSRTRFGADMGLSGFESGLNPFCRTDNLNFWCATSTDLIRMPFLNAAQRLQPMPMLRGVKVLMQDIDFQQVNRFSFSDNYLTFNIDGVWLSNPQAVRFRYKLDGLDPFWQTTKEHSLTYPNIPSGHYSFRLQTSLTDDFTGADEAVYAFDIAKPIWLKWWFLLLSLLVLGSLLTYFVKKRENRLRHEATLKQDKIIAQLELLKSQISPHFLFNSFNTLIDTIENDPKSAVEFTEHLSDFYRSILQVRKKDVISIQEELNLLNNYVFLLQKRHGKTLKISIDIKQLEKNIVPLTLQLLVENAVKHNVVSKSRPLSIFITETADGFIEISNNNQKKLNKEEGTGFGLSSLVNRYQLLTHKKVEQTETNDTFLVRIPMV